LFFNLVSHCLGSYLLVFTSSSCYAIEKIRPFVLSINVVGWVMMFIFLFKGIYIWYLTRSTGFAWLAAVCWLPTCFKDCIYCRCPCSYARSREYSQEALRLREELENMRQFGGGI